MDKYIGAISRVTDPAARRMFMLLLQEKEDIKRELDHLKARNGLPEEMNRMGATSKMPNIISKTL